MRTKLAIIGAAVCLARAAFAVTMASQPWTTNRIAEAEARVAVKITAATNAIPAPDFSQNNAQLRETIVAVSPPADLTEAMNHTRAALSAFAGTGTVERARSYGTPTRWTDASGDVWEIGYSDWTIVYNDPEMEYYGVRVVASGQGEGAYWIPYVGDSPAGVAKGNADSTEIVWLNAAITDFRATRTLLGTTNFVGRVALTNDIPDVSGYATQQQATNAATAVADTKISTNNAAFVSAVLAVPLTGADAGDLAEIAEYGGYGTVGAAVLALIAGLAALKRRMGAAETALSQKASLSDLPYALVEPGKWEFSEQQGLTNFAVTSIEYDDGDWTLSYTSDETASDTTSSSGSENATSVVFYVGVSGEIVVTATRASLPGHLCDRAGNRVVVTGDMTLTLPAAVHGYLRDFLVRLEISGSTVPTITFAAPTGETITYETDGDTFPVPDEAGNWVYSFTENCVAHKFVVSLKKVNEVAAPQAQGGS